MNVSTKLARYISKMDFDKLPGDVIKTAKERILDLIGVAIYGSSHGWYDFGFHETLLNIMAESGGKADCTVIGKKPKLPSLFAVFVNSSMGLPLSDTCRFSGAHPGVIVIPAALAVAESRRAGGREFITAVVAGYEVFLRVGRAIFPSSVERGFHATSIIGPFGSAAASSKILGLDKKELMNALGLAGSFTGGLMESFRAYDSVLVQVGRASQSGLLAALLAANGVKGSSSILEGGSLEHKGFLKAFADKFDPDIITRDLGTSFLIREVGMRTYDGVLASRAAVDAAIKLINEKRISKESVKEINVRTHSRALSLQPSKLSTGADGKFSIPFMISAAILDGEITPTTFSNKKIRNNRIRKFMEKIKVEMGQDIEKEFPKKWGAHVEIITRQGIAYKGTVYFAKGEPENKFSTLEIQDKFRRLTSGVLNTKIANQIINVIDSLDELKDISQLTSLLGK